MALPRRTLLGRLAALALVSLPALAPAQVEVWHIGKGGLDWASQAQTQIGALDVDGGLQPLQLQAGQNLLELLRTSGQRFLNGQPRDFTAAGQPRAWSNDGFFNQVNGPLSLIDGDPSTSSGSTFKSAQSQAGATFFWDLGAPFPVNRIRFYPAPDDPDAFIKAFELFINDGETFNDINRPEYRSLRRVETNKQTVVDIDFAALQGRFVQLRVLSKTIFNLAEFEVYGEGFVPVASYESELHSFGGPVNFGRLLLAATRLGASDSGDEAPTALIQMRTGADDSPLAYFRRDRDTGSQEEVSFEEYNTDLPRRALFRLDPLTGAPAAEVSRADYLLLPTEEQGPVLDFVKGDIRDDVDNWSAWSRGFRVDASGSYSFPVDLPSPRQYMQFRVFFDGDDANAVRLDTFRVEFSPSLVGQALGEVALADAPFPASGVLEVPGGVDTTFIYDIRTEFDDGAQAGYRGIRLEAFPPPTFADLQAGEPLAPVADFDVETTDSGFEVFFPAVDAGNNRPLRLAFRMRLLEHNTPINAWLLGDGDVPPHPVAPGNASDAIGTGVINAFTIEARPDVQVEVDTPLLTPNGDGVNDRAGIALTLSQFSGATGVEVDILDLGGRRVRRLADEGRAAGAFDEAGDGRDQSGALVPPGLYILRVGVEADSETFEHAQIIGVAY